MNEFLPMHKSDLIPDHQRFEAEGDWVKKLAGVEGAPGHRIAEVEAGIVLL